MAGHYRTSARRSPAATDVVTYRLDDKMIYVPLDYNWRQALAHARHSFEKLSGVDEKRITFSLNVINDGQRRSVGISPSAWRSVASHLARYEIIDIRVTPEVVITDMDAPPRYSSPSLMSSCTDTKRRCHNSSESKEGKGFSFSETQRRSQSPSPSLNGGTSKFSPKRMLQKVCSTISSEVL